MIGRRTRNRSKRDIQTGWSLRKDGNVDFAQRPHEICGSEKRGFFLTVQEFAPQKQVHESCQTVRNNELEASSMTEKKSENSVFRILDAAINRASEGLRVVEDFLRMDLADGHLAKALKQLRHDLTESTQGVDPQKRMAARDSVGDVGRTIETTAEYQRETIASGPVAQSVVQPNLARAQQALRTIEEFSKTLDPNIAKQIEQIRYRVYTAEKAILTTIVSLKHLGDARLYVLIDACGGESQEVEPFSKLRQQVKNLVEARVDVIQLRDKGLTDRELVEAGRAIVDVTRLSDTKFIMNDRVDLAMASNADGVHLGQDELQISDARRIVGAARLIGISTHSIEQARDAVLAGANYIGVGPVFPSQTKPFDSHVGLDLIAAVAKEIQLPAFAIGGITLDNVRDVCAAGQSRVAVQNAIVGADNPGRVATEFIALLS